MQALYTKTFSDFLTNNENNAEWQALISRLTTSFPSFVFGHGTGASLQFVDILIRKYKFREIGRETEELFFNTFDKKVDEVLIKFESKVNAFLENESVLMQFKVEVSDNVKYTDYLNPSVATTENLNVNSVEQRERTFNRFIAPMTSRPDLLKKIQDLQSIYYKAVEAFEPCFMGCF